MKRQSAVSVLSRLALAAAIVLLPSACTSSRPHTADCSPPDCSNAQQSDDELSRLITGDAVGLAFTMDTFSGDGGGPVTSAPVRRYFVELELDPADRTVTSLTSVAVATPERVVETARWERGWRAVRVADDGDCIEREQPLPTAPDLSAIVEDMIGPIDPARRPDSRQISPGVYEYQEDGATVRLAVGDQQLRGRTVEFIGQSGKVMSRVSSIDLGSGPAIPDRLRDAPCQRNPHSGSQTLAPG